MALSKNLQKILIGVSVKTKKRIQWHGLDIPVGSRGVIKGIEGGGKAAHVVFDNKRYGSFVCWFKELGPA